MPILNFPTFLRLYYLHELVKLARNVEAVSTYSISRTIQRILVKVGIGVWGKFKSEFNSGSVSAQCTLYLHVAQNEFYQIYN